MWHEGIGSLLLLAAVQHTGLLDAFVTAVMEVADPTIPGLSPPNPAVVARLLLTLLFLPVAGLARCGVIPGRCWRSFQAASGLTVSATRNGFLLAWPMLEQPNA